MSALELGFWSFPILLVLIFLRAPIGVAMFTMGVGGLWLATDSPNMAMNLLKAESYSTFSSYSLSIIPMFLLMGQFATLSGMSSALFTAASGWLGHRKGGVAMASVGACAGFGAICGSSLATAATMSRVALPELKRYGYSGGFSTATLAAGGTLGILIPPSVILVIYAILTEQNIASLFLAAFVPGILAAIGYMIVIAVYVRLNPDSAGLRDRVPYGERFRALAEIWPVIVVFGLVVGGIYAGWFTPTEGAAVGAAGTGLLALVKGKMTWALFKEAILTTAVSSAMIFFIVLGAKLYNSFLALTQMPQELSQFVVNQGYAPLTVLILILVFYLIMGCLMDSLSMILLTIPIFWPVMAQMDFGLISLIDMQAARLAEGIAAGIAMAPDLLAQAQAKLAEGVALTRDEFRELGLRPVTEAMHADFNTTLTAIWFGILVLIVVEVGLITPPVGMNLFIINAIDRSTPMSATYRAVLWFVTSDLIRVVILVAFPSITLFLLR
ncbi:TRAP transporter large permease [Roseicyclus mahoneyensis]|uniref:Tripartite ATP-independent transporter DctM subunit n=1 Tax=Roseicyclus mahoneyensis TaxID=164332 RepID=A0A316GN40_9RHOB|nr:TRAP transporter large permease [Roseicyclus mahoneyensis]PWK62324.1 tripartite ATP-independent transporter DctM subunit [Roseicyclus mahoneyensis]